MAYYTATGNPGALSRGASTLIRAEFALVQAGFNLLPLPAALSGGNSNYVVDTGIANAYVVAPAAAVTSMTDGMSFLVKYGNPNTGPSTITLTGVTGGGSIPLVRPDGSALQLGDILAGEIILTAYSSSMGKFQLAVSSAAAIATAAASATAAATSASAAAASSASAQTYAGALNGTSTTSTTIGTGSKTFAASTGKQWAVGSWLVLASAANTANFMYGQVTAYNAGTGALTVNVGSTGGSGTQSDWVISLSTALANTLTQAQATTQISTAVSAAVGSDGTLSFRSRLHNGNLSINQRAVSGTVTLAAGAYGHDRWKAGSGGCTYTFAASGADTIITISSGSLMQVVEGANVEGGVYTLTNRGSAQARIAVSGAATSGSYAVASTGSPLASTSATANQTMTVEFSTGTLDRVQLEPGTVATVFQRRPVSIELTACRRYARPIPRTTGQALATTSVSSYADTSDMRSPPTLSTSSGWTAVQAGGATASCTTVTINSNVNGDTQLFTNSTTGMVSGNASALIPPAGALFVSEL